MWLALIPSAAKNSVVRYGVVAFSHLPSMILPVIGSEEPKNLEVRISVQLPPSSWLLKSVEEVHCKNCVLVIHM